jgi:hypothetical protein
VIAVDSALHMNSAYRGALFVSRGLRGPGSSSSLVLNPIVIAIESARIRPIDTGRACRRRPSGTRFDDAREGRRSHRRSEHVTSYRMTATQRPFRAGPWMSPRSFALSVSTPIPRKEPTAALKGSCHEAGGLARRAHRSARKRDHRRCSGGWPRPTRARANCRRPTGPPHGYGSTRSMVETRSMERSKEATRPMPVLSAQATR